MTMPEELNEHGLVFHFTKAKAVIESILFYGNIRFAPLNRMNDPHEYKLVSRGVQSLGNIDEIVASQALSTLRKAILFDSKMLCFVEHKKNSCDAFDLPFTKPRSWAQYGEEQHGVCLAFRKNKLLANIRSNIDNVSIFEGPVAYDLDTKSQSKKNFIKEYDNKLTVEENVKRHIEAQKKDIYFRKYRDFKDENEYRIVLLDREQKSPEYIICPIKGALHSVILGDRFHKGYIELVKELVAKLGANTFILTYGSVPYINKC